MLTPGYANLWMHFYPIGNTPAVCLTQCLPLEKQANILLLGCGDVRNILFTAHSDDGRQMDITCCDIETSVIARNILLITLILGDADGQGNADNWDIYYHVFFNRACHERLQMQAKKLYGLAASLATWRVSPYSKLLRFCDVGTLARVAKTWAFYISAATTERQSTIKKAFKSVIKFRKDMIGNADRSLTGLRFTTPAGLLAVAAFNDISNHF